MPEKIGDAGSRHQLGSPIERVALADAAEVQLHAWLPKKNGAGRFIQLHMLAADARERLLQDVGLGNRAGTTIKPPGLGQWPGRDVVGTVGSAKDFGGPAEQRK